MRKLLFIAISLLSFNVMASSVEVKIVTRSHTTDDDFYQRGGSEGIQLSYINDKSGYAFVSYDNIAVYPMGRGFNYELIGIGLGHKVKVTKNIRFYGQAGYYLISNTWGGMKRGENEAFLYYLNGKFNDATGGTYQYFDEFGVYNENSIGGEVGLELLYPLSKSVNLITSMSYRVLRIKEVIRGNISEYENGGVWEYGVSKDYSSFNFSIGLNYDF